MSFETNIQSWVSLDNELKILNNKTRELREKRNLVSDSIINNRRETTTTCQNAQARATHNAT